MTRLWMFFAIDALTGIKLQGYVEAQTERQARERIQLAMKRIVVGTTDVGFAPVPPDMLALADYHSTLHSDLVARAPYHLQEFS
jgi:hypothetical protein